MDKSVSFGIYKELKDILDEYENKMIECNSSDGMGLSLDNNKQVIMQHAIGRLQTLELQVADIMKKDSKNQSLKDEGAILREKLDKKIVLTSQEQVEEKHKVCSLAMER